MSLKINFTGLFATVASIEAKAEVVAKKAYAYAQTIEEIGEQAGMSGVQKLEALKTALVNDVAKTDSALASTLASDWNAVAGAVSGMVALYKASKALLAKVAPAVEAAVPQSKPVIDAIEDAEAVVDGVIDHAETVQP